MKFAEMTQEVQIARPTPMKLEYGMTPGRRKANQIFKMAVNRMEENGRIEARKLDVDIGLVYSLGPKFPDYNVDPEQAGQLVAELIQLLDQRIQKRVTLNEDYSARRKSTSNDFNLFDRISDFNWIFLSTEDAFRMILVQQERDYITVRTENATLQGMLKLEREKVSIYEKKIESKDIKNDELSRKLRECENQLRDAQKELSQARYMLSQKELEQEKQKKKYSTKIAAENEKLSREMQMKLRAQNDRLNVSRSIIKYT